MPRSTLTLGTKTKSLMLHPLSLHHLSRSLISTQAHNIMYGETTEQRTRWVGASAAVPCKEPVSGNLSAANNSQPPPATTDIRVDALLEGPKERVSAGIVREKGPYPSLHSSPLEFEPPKEMVWSRAPGRCSMVNIPHHYRSLLSGFLTSISSTLQRRLTKLLIDNANGHKSTVFDCRYATECPYWICCCEAPTYEDGLKLAAEHSGNCVYHVCQLAQRCVCTIEEYQQYLFTQETLHRTISCICREPAAENAGNQVTIIRGGLILAQVWREHLTRRYSSFN